jgi:hypothetical protein
MSCSRTRASIAALALAAAAAHGLPLSAQRPPMGPRFAYSPVGTDGYPQPLWNKETGVIDRGVAAKWKKYDLLETLKANWPTLGPKVANKLNVYVGDMDSYYLNDAVENLNTFLTKADNPTWTGEIVFERRAPHCWGPSAEQLLDKLTRQVEAQAPAGSDVQSWRYR